MTKQQLNGRECNVTRRSYLKSIGAIGGGLSILEVGTDTASAQQPPFEYRGRVTTIIQTTDFYGNQLQPQQYEKQAAATVDRPATHEGITETNPFNISFEAQPQGTDGSLVVISATSYTGVLHQYWKITYDRTNGSFEGTLTDTHGTEASAFNILYMTQEVAPNIPVSGFLLPMAEGTKMRGQVNQNAFKVDIRGIAHGPTTANAEFAASLDCRRI